MGVLDRFERGIEKAVNGAFARAFKSEVQPVEITSALRRAMDDRAAVVGRGRTLVPNAFVVELGPTDYDRLTEYAEVLSDELIANVSEHADAQQYVFPGPVTVGFELREDLDTGVFQVRSSTVRGAPPAAPPQPLRHRAGAARRGATRSRAGRPGSPGAAPAAPAPFPMAPAPFPMAPAGPPADRAGVPVGSAAGPAGAPPGRPPALAGRRRPRLPVARAGHHRRPRRRRRRGDRRPGRLAAARRDPGHHRRPAPDRPPARPRLHQRHVHRRQSGHGGRAAGGQLDHVGPDPSDLPERGALNPAT